MGKVDLKQAQELMKSILKDVHRICEENKIEYWIESGTLLGAVRHKGFIPWDDDIDIGMKREDYNKFVAIAEKELPEDLIFENKQRDNDVLYSWGKVKHLYSEMIEEGNDCKNKGLFVDIFPYDYYEEDRSCELSKKKKNNVRNIKIIYNSNLEFEKNTKKNIKRLFCKVYCKLILKENMNRYMCKIIEEAKTNSQTKRNVLGYGTEVDLFDICYKTDDIFPTKKMIFEDIEVKAPNRPRNILKQLYGENFMEIPKEEDRYTHNSGIYIEKYRE